ncbi:MAG: outer membrane beta-barrel protein [Flavisolibacter sp.]
MKKLLIVVAFLFSVGYVTAQKSPVQLNLYGHYVFQDRIEFDGFYGYAKEGFQYGAGLEYLLENYASIELKYLRQNTNFPVYTPNGNTHLNSGKDAGSINYILLGGTGYMPGTSASKVLPYAGIGLGVGILDGKESGKSATKFAWDAKLGIQIKTAGKISLKLQTTLQSIMSTFGSDFYVSSVGTVIAVPDYATLLQFGLGGGIVFRF